MGSVEHRGQEIVRRQVDEAPAATATLLERDAHGCQWREQMAWTGAMPPWTREERAQIARLDPPPIREQERGDETEALGRVRAHRRPSPVVSRPGGNDNCRATISS